MLFRDYLYLIEAQTPETKKLSFVIAAAKLARKKLSAQAEYAIETWQHSNWDSGKLEKAFSGKDPKLEQEIENVFEPVKAVLKAQFGDKIPLYRGQRHYQPDNLSKKGRMLFSWTFSLKVAKMFLQNPKKVKEISDEEIERAVDQYNRTGYAKLGGEQFLRDKNNPEYFNIYKRKQLITDGDDLEEYLKDIQRERREYNERENKKESGYVADYNMPIDDIVWITNDLGSLEFICKKNPLSL